MGGQGIGEDNKRVYLVIIPNELRGNIISDNYFYNKHYVYALMSLLLLLFVYT